MRLPLTLDSPAPESEFSESKVTVHDPHEESKREGIFNIAVDSSTKQKEPWSGTAVESTGEHK